MAGEVPLQAHLEALAVERDLRYSAERRADQLAIEKAEAAASSALEAHNGLLRKMEKEQSTYALKTDIARLESWQARITGGMIIIGIIGISNLVKLWAG